MHSLWLSFILNGFLGSCLLFFAFFYGFSWPMSSSSSIISSFFLLLSAIFPVFSLSPSLFKLMQFSLLTFSQRKIKFYESNKLNDYYCYCPNALATNIATKYNLPPHPCRSMMPKVKSWKWKSKKKYVPIKLNQLLSRNVCMCTDYRVLCVLFIRLVKNKNKHQFRQYWLGCVCVCVCARMATVKFYVMTSVQNDFYSSVGGSALLILWLKVGFFFLVCAYFIPFNETDITQFRIICYSLTL